jgi:hypothetical protein
VNTEVEGTVKDNATVTDTAVLKVPRQYPAVLLVKAGYHEKGVQK